MTSIHDRIEEKTAAGVVTGVPNLVLRAEGLAVLGAALTAYQALGHSWWLFAALFLTPDVFMLGYLGSNRAGAIGYNLGHTYLAPAALALAAWAAGQPLGLALAAIWLAHTGFDRMVGYGLKYQRGFKFNHLSAPEAR